MLTINMHEAKTQLSRLVEQALAGEEVVIAKAGKPVVRLTPIVQATKPRRKLGALAGRIRIAPDFDETSPEIIDAFHASKSDL